MFREADPQLIGEDVEAEGVTHGPKVLPLGWPWGEWSQGKCSEPTLRQSPGLCRLALPLRPAEGAVFLNEARERCHCFMS